MPGIGFWSPTNNPMAQKAHVDALRGRGRQPTQRASHLALFLLVVVAAITLGLGVWPGAPTSDHREVTPVTEAVEGPGDGHGPEQGREE